MSIDYQYFFSPSSFDRISLMKMIFPIIKSLPMLFTSYCYGIEWDNDLEEFRHSFLEIKAENLNHALAQTIDWNGVSFAFDMPIGSRSIYLWKDRKTNKETLSIYDNSSLFVSIDEDIDAWKNFEKFLIDIIEAINSDFCICRADPEMRTVYTEDIVRLIHEIKEQKNEINPILIIVKSDLVPSKDIDSTISGKYQVRFTDKYLIIKDSYYGTGPKD